MNTMEPENRVIRSAIRFWSLEARRSACYLEAGCSGWRALLRTLMCPPGQIREDTTARSKFPVGARASDRPAVVALLDDRASGGGSLDVLAEGRMAAAAHGEDQR